MTAFSHLQDGVERVLDTLSEGWRYLKHQAANAVTRFTPGQGAASEDDGRPLAVKSTSWGLLAADIREDEGAVHVRLEAPGMEAEDFDIVMRDRNLLSVKGEKHVQREDQRGDFHIVECAYGRFERVIPLPASVDVEHAQADYKNGVLRIDLPKREKSRRVKISTLD